MAIYYSESFKCRCYSTVHCGDVLLGVLSVGVTKYCTDSGHVLFGEFQVSGLCNSALCSVIAVDIFQTGVTSVKWRKLFRETGQTMTATGLIMAVPLPELY